MSVRSLDWATGSILYGIAQRRDASTDDGFRRWCDSRAEEVRTASADIRREYEEYGAPPPLPIPDAILRRALASCVEGTAEHLALMRQLAKES